MKIIYAAFLFLSYSNLKGQLLGNTEWTQVKAERKDGSRILDNLKGGELSTKYYFKEQIVFFIQKNLFTQELKYSVKDKILTIGEFAQYNIDTVDHELLVLTQIPKNKTTDDKINRFYFINRKSIFEYLKENDQLKIIGDSIIEYNSLLAPTYYGNLDELFSKEFESIKDNRSLTGMFIINSKGGIGNILCNDNKFSKKEVESIKKVLNYTDNKWIMPSTVKPFSYKMNFEFKIFNYQDFSGTGFSFIAEGVKQESGKNLTMKQVAEADNYFNRGNELIRSENYEKAIKQYLKCLEIDTFYIDAYYNLAFCYQTSGKTNLACETWDKLKIMGQKQGEYLFNQNCK